MGLLLRLIVWGGILWFAYTWLQRTLHGAPSQPPAAPGNDAPPPSSGGFTATMRKCSQCGVHIPEGESTQSRGHFFCCEAHRDAFFRQQG